MPFGVKSEQLNYSSGAQKLRIQLQRAKKTNAEWITITENKASRKASKKMKTFLDLESGINNP